MRTATSSHEKKVPACRDAHGNRIDRVVRSYSVLITFNECKPNRDGGDRTTTKTAKNKKLAVPQVVVSAIKVTS